MKPEGPFPGTGSTLTLSAPPGGERLDLFLAREAGVSRSGAQRLIREGRATVNEGRVKPSYRLRPDDRIRVEVPAPAPPPGLVPEVLPLTIHYEDEDLAVVDKPPGMPVHPSPGHPRGTLLNALLARIPALVGMGGDRPGIVHRLDQGTSGLLVVAKNPAALAHLQSQFKRRLVTKGYLVLVRGRLQEEGVVEVPLARHPRHRQKMAAVAGGRQARTRYRPLREIDGYTLVEAFPETGRTHQVRVHLAHRGYPVVGDPVYGVRSPFLRRQFLHAHYLHLRHPRLNQEMEFHSPLPPDLAGVLPRLAGVPKLP